MAQSIKTLLVNELIDAVHSVTYPIVITDNQTHKQSVSDVETATEYKVAFNEIRSTFQRSQEGARLSLRRVAWAFQGLLKFNKEVDLGNLVDLLTGNIESDVLTDSQGRQAVYIAELSDYTVSHPCHNGTSGTDAVFTINVSQKR